MSSTKRRTTVTDKNDTAVDESSSSSSSRWYSPIFDETTTSAVSVPRSGWYGFSLGIIAAAAFEAAAAATAEDETSSIVLRIQPPILLPDNNANAKTESPCAPDSVSLSSSSSSSSSSSTSHKLPFEFDGEQLLDLHIGRLLYLSQGSRVSVVPVVVDDVVQQGSITTSTTIIDAPSSFQWRLVCVRMTDRMGDAGAVPPAVGTLLLVAAQHRPPPQGRKEPNNSDNDSTSYNNTNNNNNNNGTSSIMNPIMNSGKPLACAVCGRAFFTLRAVRVHLQSAHNITPTTTTTATNQNSTGNSTSMQTTNKTMMAMAMHCDSFSSCDPMWTTPLSVVYQDAYLAVVCKPQGMPVYGNKQTLCRSDLLLPLANSKNNNDNEEDVSVGPKAKKQKKRARTNTSNGNNEDNDDDNKKININDSSIVHKYLHKPRPVHRLDAGTGGLLVVAKTFQAETELKRAWENRSCRKTYICICVGALLQSSSTTSSSPDSSSNGTSASSGICEIPLSGKPAVTHYKVVRQVPSTTWGHLTVVELHPITGRKHQLRRHLQMLGHAILGDARYGKLNDCYYNNNNVVDEKETSSDCSSTAQHPYSRLCLWAVELRFPHPVTNQELHCKMEEPEWLQFVLRYEEEQWKNAAQKERQETAEEAERVDNKPQE